MIQELCVEKITSSNDNKSSDTVQCKRKPLLHMSRPATQIMCHPSQHYNSTYMIQQRDFWTDHLKMLMLITVHCVTVNKFTMSFTRNIYLMCVKRMQGEEPLFEKE